MNYLIASSAAMWFVDSITNNAVVLSDSADSVTYIKLLDGSYNPPPGHVEALTLSGGTYTVTTPQQEKLNFNSAGNVATYVDPAGVTVTYNYTGSQLTSVSNPLCRDLE